MASLRHTLLPAVPTLWAILNQNKALLGFVHRGTGQSGAEQLSSGWVCSYGKLGEGRLHALGVV